MTVEDLVVSHVDWIRRKARRYYDDPLDADDLAGETIYKCLSQAGTFDPSRHFRPWALAIMANTFKTGYARRQKIETEPYPEYDIIPATDAADQRMALMQMLSVIRKCRRKSCCVESVMLYAKGYSYDEIANLLGILPGTVKSRLLAGRKLLREALGL